MCCLTYRYKAVRLYGVCHKLFLRFKLLLLKRRAGGAPFFCGCVNKLAGWLLLLYG